MALIAQQIRYFLQIVESGSFTKASKKLFLSHQALMKQMALLEKELGGPLLERSLKGVQLTPFGKYVHPLLEKLNWDIDKTFEQIKRYHSRDQASIRLGIFSALPKEQLVTPFLTFLLGKFPDRHIALEMMTTADGREKLESGQLDLFLTYIHEEELWDGYRRLVFQALDAQVCVSLYHPWVIKDAVTLEDLAQETLIKLQAEAPSYTVPKAQSFFDTIPCRDSVNVKNFDTLLAMLEHGGGFAVFPMSFSNMDRARCKAFPYPGRQLKFYMSLVCYPEGMNRLVDQVLESAREEFDLQAMT